MTRATRNYNRFCYRSRCNFCLGYRYIKRTISLVVFKRWQCHWSKDFARNDLIFNLCLYLVFFDLWTCFSEWLELSRQINGLRFRDYVGFLLFVVSFLFFLIFFLDFDLFYRRLFFRNNLLKIHNFDFTWVSRLLQLSFQLCQWCFSRLWSYISKLWHLDALWSLFLLRGALYESFTLNALLKQLTLLALKPYNARA